jgi:hypothetical protein
MYISDRWSLSSYLSEPIVFAIEIMNPGHIIPAKKYILTPGAYAGGWNSAV